MWRSELNLTKNVQYGTDLLNTIDDVGLHPLGLRRERAAAIHKENNAIFHERVNSTWSRRNMLGVRGRDSRKRAAGGTKGALPGEKFDET